MSKKMKVCAWRVEPANHCVEDGMRRFTFDLEIVNPETEESQMESGYPQHLIDSPTLSVWENEQAFLVTERKRIHLGGADYIDRVYQVAKEPLTEPIATNQK